jgi:hypothetical protein
MATRASGSYLAHAAKITEIEKLEGIAEEVVRKHAERATAAFLAERNVALVDAHGDYV